METIDTNIRTSEATSTTINENESAINRQNFAGAGSEHGYTLYARPRTQFARVGRYGRVTRAIINYEPGL
jgi:hypothetical protein